MGYICWGPNRDQTVSYASPPRETQALLWPKKNVKTSVQGWFENWTKKHIQKKVKSRKIFFKLAAQNPIFILIWILIIACMEAAWNANLINICSSYFALPLTLVAELFKPIWPNQLVGGGQPKKIELENICGSLLHAYRGPMDGGVCCYLLDPLFTQFTYWHNLPWCTLVCFPLHR